MVANAIAALLVFVPVAAYTPPANMPAAAYTAPASAARRPATPRCSEDDGGWQRWADKNGVTAPKLAVRLPTAEERGKSGVSAAEAIAELEVAARIPRELVVSCTTPASSASWPADLTAAALEARWGANGALRTWVESWSAGGWATDSVDLGADDVRFGARDVIGSLLSTGSDLDQEIYKKFGLKCHPVVHRAAKGLSMLTRCDEGAARGALVLRGSIYRAMRDELFALVEVPTERKGSLRERRCWDVADMLSRVLSRATTLALDGEGASCAIVPLHERLAHSGPRGENVKLVCDPVDGEHVLLVATRAIGAGEELTRDYDEAPRLPGDETDGALRLLVQFGLPPAAWPEAGWAGPMGGYAEGEAEV